MCKKENPIPGKIIAVTNRSLCERPFLEQIKRVCETKPAALILREKTENEEKQIKFMSGNLSMDQKNKNKLILGCSVHSVEDAIEAEKLGASYLTAGHIFATDCKRGLPPRGMEFLKQVCETVNIPVYAIGGIGLNDGKIDSVCECGAAGACIMSAFMAI